MMMMKMIMILRKAVFNFRENHFERRDFVKNYFEDCFENYFHDDGRDGVDQRGDERGRRRQAHLKNKILYLDEHPDDRDEEEEQWSRSEESVVTDYDDNYYEEDSAAERSYEYSRRRDDGGTDETEYESESTRQLQLVYSDQSCLAEDNLNPPADAVVFAEEVFEPVEQLGRFNGDRRPWLLEDSDTVEWEGGMLRIWTQFGLAWRMRIGEDGFISM